LQSHHAARVIACASILTYRNLAQISGSMLIAM
jgi:hypothetical protein